MKQTNTITAKRFLFGLVLGILIPATQFIVLDKGHQDNLNRLKSLESDFIQEWTAQEGQLAKDPSFLPTVKDPVRKDPVRFAEASLVDTNPIWGATTY